MSATDLTSGSATISASALVLNPATLDLAAGASSPSAIILTIPSGQKAGTYTGLVNATLNSTNNDAVTVMLTVNEVASYAASATTPTIVQGGSGLITVTVTNAGNADMNSLSYTVTSPFTSGTNNMAVSGSTTGNLVVAQGSSNNFVISFNPSAAQPTGTYTSQVQMSYKGVVQTLTLNVVVTSPTFSVSLPVVQHAESERDVNVSTDVTITNNGDLVLTGITMSSTGAASVVTGAVPSTLIPGGQFIVKVYTMVPLNADSGIDTVGSLVFKSNELNTSSEIRTDAVSHLEFNAVKVSIADGSWDTLTKGSTADDDARPGDVFGVQVKMENTFDSDYDDGDMGDVTIDAIFFRAGADGDDIEGNLDLSLDAGEKGDLEEIDFDDDYIDWDVDAGKLTVELVAEAEDDNGAMHRAVFNFSINVDRENKADFTFMRFDAPSQVECGRSFRIYVEGRSIGEKSDDSVVLKIESTQFDFNVREEFAMGAYDEDDGCDALERDADDCTEFNYYLDVDVPANMAPGSYPIVAKLFRDGGNTQTDDADLQVTVACGSKSSSSSGSSTTQSTSKPSSSTDTTSTKAADVEVVVSGTSQSSTQSSRAVATGPARVTDTTSDSGAFKESGAYLAVLSLLSILVIVGIVVTLVYAFSKPKL
ncbi:MAG: hypothetical protein V1729_02405 [Candidatus Woesearchaeota archaeon]